MAEHDDDGGRRGTAPGGEALGRREFLGVTAGVLLGLAGAGGCGEDDEPERLGERIEFDPDAVAESTEVFPRTPMAGEMKATSILVAGHVDPASDSGPITLRVWQPAEAEGQVHLVHEAEVSPDTAGFFKAPVEGLLPGEWFEYGLFAGDAASGFSARSLIGRVRTALAEGSLEPVRIAFGACVGRGILPEYVDPDAPTPYEPWDTMLVAAEQEYDLFIHLGDQGYMDTVYDKGGALQRYLDAWGAYHGGGYRVVYPRSGLYMTWDDHEVTNNGTVDPWTTNAEERAKIEHAIEAYYTVMPIDAASPADALWRSFRWGDTVEFIVLDCRYERQTLESGVYMSDEQFQFLLDRLENSPCHFKCVVNSVPLTRLNLPDDLPGANTLVNPDDRWEGYGVQRAALLERVSERGLSNILWITGDVHMCWVGQIEANPSSAGESMWEVCVTSGNENPLANELSDDQFPWHSPNPHLPLLTFDPAANRVLVEFLDAQGELAHRRELDLSSPITLRRSPDSRGPRGGSGRAGAG